MANTDKSNPGAVKQPVERPGGQPGQPGTDPGTPSTGPAPPEDSGDPQVTELAKEKQPGQPAPTRGMQPQPR